jgi:hypothetical protein
MGKQLDPEIVQNRGELFDAFIARGGVAEVWHIADTPSGVVLHCFSGKCVAVKANEILRHQDIETSEAVALAYADLATQVRQELGFPEDWVPAEEWNSAMSYGEPHPRKVAQAIRVQRVE